jgi:DNA-binding response OmpR family regulator
MIDLGDYTAVAAAAPTILIVEDNAAFAEALRMSYEVEGYATEWVADGDAALEWLGEHHADVIVLDLMLPKTNGFEVLRRYRAMSGSAAVLILSARDQEVDKVQGFRLGADDYVVKSVGLLELLARTQALLRRVKGADLNQQSVATGPRFVFGDIVVDMRTRSVTKQGAAVDLTPMEYDLLIHLIRTRGTIMSREVLLRQVWRYSPGLTSRTVDQHLSRLRIKLENDPSAPVHFLTVRKAGYRFEP